MSEPDEAMVEAVAQVLWEGNSTPFICWADLSEPLREMQYEQARAVLSVPVVRDALARDAKVAEIVAEVEGRVKDRAQAEAAAIVSFGQIATMYAARATSPSPVNVPAPCERVARCGDYRPFSGPDTYATISGNRPDYDPGV